MTAILIRIGQALEAEWDVLTTLDAHSGETWDCTALFGDDDYTEQVQEMFPEAIWLGDILLVTNMEIKPEYRGHDAGLIAMRAVINMFSGGCSLVVCKPFPLQYTSKVTAANRKEFRIAERKLRKYWVKAGFKRVPGTDMYALSVA